MPSNSTNINILNSIRPMMSYDYQSQIPKATQDNISNIYNTILNSQNARNALVPALVDLIISQSISTGIFRNKLRLVKGDNMPFGSTEQEIFVNFANGIEHNPKATADEIYGIYESYVMAAYHRINFNMDYPVTIWYEDLRTAFMSDYGLKSMVSAKVESIVSKANWDEFLTTKQLISSAYEAGNVYPVNISAITDKDTANALLEAVQEYADLVAFPNTSLNIAGATSITNREELLFITTPKVKAKINVQTLASVFNLDKAEVDVQTIVVDDFNDNNEIQAVLVNKRWFKIRDQYRLTTTDYAGLAMRWNNVYHVKEMFSYSPYYPCIVFTTAQAGVSGIKFAVGDATYKPGTETDITLGTTVSGGVSSVVPKMVSYKIEGNTSGDTFIIPGTDILRVAKNETADTIKITAYSRYKPNVSAELNINKTA